MLAFNPRFISSSPIGDMQLVGGDIIFVSCIALYNFSASSLAMRCGEAFSGIFAFVQISFATAGLTRENSNWRHLLTCRALDDCSIFIRLPNSTPYGCGFIAFGSIGSLLVDLLYTIVVGTVLLFWSIFLVSFFVFSSVFLLSFLVAVSPFAVFFASPLGRVGGGVYIIVVCGFASAVCLM